MWLARASVPRPPAFCTTSWLFAAWAPDTLPEMAVSVLPADRQRIPCLGLPALRPSSAVTGVGWSEPCPQEQQEALGGPHLPNKLCSPATLKISAFSRYTCTVIYLMVFSKSASIFDLNLTGEKQGKPVLL